MDRLAAIASYVRIVELGSLSAAARELGLSQPAISQQLTALEKHLGVRLLQRTTRQLTATRAGDDYYAHAKTILAAVDASETALSSDASVLKGHLRIQAPTGLGQQFIAGIAIAFQQLHPGVRIDLLLDDRVSDLVGEGVDVAIRLGPLPPSMAVARKLGSLERVLVASPAYIACHGSPETPEALAVHAHVRYSWLTRGDEISLIGPDGPVAIRVPTRFMANNAFVLIEALMGGVGVGGVQLPLVRRALADGSLVQVMRRFAYAEMEVHAVYPSRRYLPERVRAFADYLGGRLAEAGCF